MSKNIFRASYKIRFHVLEDVSTFSTINERIANEDESA